MSERNSSADLARLAADLTRSLQELQRELEPDRRRPPLPTPRDMLRLTDEVAIPALILFLETNIRALQLLQRAIRLADDRDGRPTGSDGPAVHTRAIEVSQTTLSRLDEVLADVQDAIAGRPEDEETRATLREAQSLREEIDAQLASVEGETDTGGFDSTDRTDVPVDVDAELQSIKDDLDDQDGQSS